MREYPASAVERAMKIQEVILRAMAKEITWRQAAEIMGSSDRSMRSWRQWYEEHGYGGLFDQRRGKPSPKQPPRTRRGDPRRTNCKAYRTRSGSANITSCLFRNAVVRRCTRNCGRTWGSVPQFGETERKWCHLSPSEGSGRRTSQLRRSLGGAVHGRGVQGGRGTTRRRDFQSLIGISGRRILAEKERAGGAAISHNTLIHSGSRLAGRGVGGKYASNIVASGRPILALAPHPNRVPRRYAGQAQRKHASWCCTM